MYKKRHRAEWYHAFLTNFYDFAHSRRHPVAQHDEIWTSHLAPVNMPFLLASDEYKNMPRLSTIELFKESMKFSAGHFAIFSNEIRENLHGHNYNVCASFTTIIDDEGLSFDYRSYKHKVRSICDSLNEITLIPGKSKYLRIEPAGEYTNIHFHNEKLIFLNRDIKVLPVFNITVEELSNWVLNEILQDQDELDNNKIQDINIKVFSGPGQSGSASWSREHD